MPNPENMVCPWIGCGGTIIRRTSFDPDIGQGWVCNTCGELFLSPDDYDAKLRKENQWAEAWINWADVTDKESPDQLEVEKGISIAAHDELPVEEEEAGELTITH